jgi:hypothetical protein
MNDVRDNNLRTDKIEKPIREECTNMLAGNNN